MFKDGRKIAGFNLDFDISMLSNLFGKDSPLLHLINDNGIMDVRKEFGNILYPNRKTHKYDIGRLQDFVGMLYGEEDEDSHSSSADAYSTYDVYSNFDFQ